MEQYYESQLNDWSRQMNFQMSHQQKRMQQQLSELAQAAGMPPPAGCDVQFGQQDMDWALQHAVERMQRARRDADKKVAQAVQKARPCRNCSRPHVSALSGDSRRERRSCSVGSRCQKESSAQAQHKAAADVRRSVQDAERELAYALCDALRELSLAQRDAEGTMQRGQRNVERDLAWAQKEAERAMNSALKDAERELVWGSRNRYQ